MAGLDVPVSNLTLGEIRRVDMGSWFSLAFAGQQVPTLAEAVGLAWGQGIGV